MEEVKISETPVTDDEWPEHLLKKEGSLIVLVTNDAKEWSIPKEAALLSKTLQSLMGEIESVVDHQNRFELKNISGETMFHIVRYMKYFLRHNNQLYTSETQPSPFFVPNECVRDVMIASHFLEL